MVENARLRDSVLQLYNYICAGVQKRIHSEGTWSQFQFYSPANENLQDKMLPYPANKNTPTVKTFNI